MPPSAPELLGVACCSAGGAAPPPPPTFFSGAGMVMVDPPVSVKVTMAVSGPPLDSAPVAKPHARIGLLGVVRLEFRVSHREFLVGAPLHLHFVLAVAIGLALGAEIEALDADRGVEDVAFAGLDLEPAAREVIVHVGLQIGDGDIELVRELVAEADFAAAGARARREERSRPSLQRQGKIAREPFCPP